MNPEGRVKHASPSRTKRPYQQRATHCALSPFKRISDQG